MFGLKWLLDVIEQVKGKADKSDFFQFLRSSYSILEVSCLKNKGGRYLEIAEYHSGGQKGCIRIPEGAKATGWKKMENEIWSFFLGKEARNRVPEAIPTGGAAGRSITAANGNSGISGSSRDSRALGKSIAPFTPTDVWRNNCLDSNLNSRVLMNPEAPRPTRKTSFTWNPSAKSLRVTKNEGEPRKAQWVSLKFKAVGLAPPKVGPQAQPERINISDPAPMDSDLHASPVNTSNVEAEASRLSDSQRDSSDEASRSSLGASELSFVPPVNFEVTVVNNPGTEMEEGELGGDLCSDNEDASDIEAEEVRVDLDDSAIELGLPLTVGFLVLTFSDEALQVIETSGALEEENLLSVVNHYEARECSSPLSCSPLAMIIPIEFPNSVDVLDANASKEEISQWVKKHYRGFCKLVGFPLDSHEQQCMALLRSIEAERL